MAHQGRRGMFGALSDCAPDRWGRTLLKRQEAVTAKSEGRRPRELTEADFLLGVRDDLRQGALRLTVGGSEFLAQSDVGVPTLTELPELLNIAADYEKDDIGLVEIRRLVGAGSSLGGTRPKTHVRDHEGHLAIAKFPSRSDEWDVMAWEKVALELARDAGSAVPPAQRKRAPNLSRTRRGHRASLQPRHGGPARIVAAHRVRRSDPQHG